MASLVIETACCEFILAQSKNFETIDSVLDAYVPTFNKKSLQESSSGLYCHGRGDF